MKTTFSGYLAFMWAIILFFVLWPLSCLEILTRLIQPHTYPGWVISDVIGYAVLDAVTIMVSIYVAHRLYRVGSHFRIRSLRLVAASWLVLAAASTVPIPFMYQYALDEIESYMYYINHGIIPEPLFIPFGSPIVRPLVSALIVIASFTFVIMTLDMRHKTGLNYFAVPAIIALVSAASTILASNKYAVTFSIGVATLIFGIAIVVFTAALGQLARRAVWEKTGTIVEKKQISQRDN